MTEKTISNLMYVSTHKVTTTDNTIWYSSEKIPKDEAYWYSAEINKHTVEVLSRIIIKDESGKNKSYEGGRILFSIHNKVLYDRIFEYFDLQKRPSSLVSLLDRPIQFELYTTDRITCWSSSEGSISCFHEWYGQWGCKDPGKIGKINLKISSKLLFEKFML